MGSGMWLPCEFSVRSVVPAIRALVAKELSASYRMNQGDIASLLGITQSAVSQYMRGVRGGVIDIGGIGEVQSIVDILAHGLVNETLSKRQVSQNVCAACKVVREKGVLCSLHKKLEPDYDVDSCDYCMNANCW